MLVVGGRYGSIDVRSGKSITNLEYLAAREKGIPLYVFVEERVLDACDRWKSDPSANYATTVDTPEVFRFIDRIRSDEKVWVSAFQTAREIIGALRIQLAHRAYEGLRLEQRLRGDGLPAFLRNVGPEALRLALEQPPGWEILLFFQSWLDEVHSRSEGLLDHHNRLSVGAAEDVHADQAVAWLNTRIHEIRQLSDVLNNLLNVQANTAIGPPGSAGDMQRILWTTRKIGEALQFALDWGHRVRRAHVRQPFTEVAHESSRFADDLIVQITSTPEGNLARTRAALSAISSGSDRQELSFSLTFALSNLEQFQEAVRRAERRA